MKIAPSLHTHAKVTGVGKVGLFKILDRGEALSGAWPRADILVIGGEPIEGCAGTVSVGPFERERVEGGIQISELRDPETVRVGDVVRLRPDASNISLVYRRASKANVLFVTERCNSRCLMCSQPPRDVDDAWRLEELHRLVGLVDLDEQHLAVTGGEPTLLGEGLAQLLAVTRNRLPRTHIHVLTNGRLFRDEALARSLIAAGSGHTMWAVPLYGDVATVHDEIVDAPGAFEETLEGLYQLAIGKARVEIRIVLHALSVPRLRQLTSFIYRRLPFVEHVTFMGLEPMGYTKGNRERLWIDPADYVEALADAVHHLAVRSVNVSIYNLPLCVLPQDLWKFAKASISDWKNRGAPECESCSMQDRCSGFFASAGPAWRSRLVAPIADAKLGDSYGGMTHELA